MKDDSFIEKARKAGRDYLASFNDDLGAIIVDLKCRTEAARISGHKVASFPPRFAKPAQDSINRSAV